MGIFGFKSNRMAFSSFFFFVTRHILTKKRAKDITTVQRERGGWIFATTNGRGGRGGK
jgi:hypothetical protein